MVKCDTTEEARPKKGRLLTRKPDRLFPPLKFKSVEKCFLLKVRGRLEEDPAFAAVTVESERIRLFNEHVSSLEVGFFNFDLNGSSIFSVL